MGSVHTMEKLLKPLGDDNTSGSVQIALHAMKRIRRIIRDKNTRVTVRLLGRIAEQLILAQPSMGIMLNLAHGIGKMKGKALRNDMLLFLDGFETSIETHRRLIAGKVFNLLKGKNSVVMTYSASSTVLESLKFAYKHGRKFSVVILESRPMNEGRKMMVSLAKSSIPVTYMTDAAGMSMLVSEQVDTILLGGDALYGDGFVCKTGSRAIAGLCAGRKVHVYGLCGTEKTVPEELKSRFVVVDRPAKELTDFRNKFVTVLNRYFEVVPSDLFTGIITD